MKENKRKKNRNTKEKIMEKKKDGKKNSVLPQYSSNIFDSKLPVANDAVDSWTSVTAKEL